MPSKINTNDKLLLREAEQAAKEARTYDRMLLWAIGVTVLMVVSLLTTMFYFGEPLPLWYIMPVFFGLVGVWRNLYASDRIDGQNALATTMGASVHVTMVPTSANMRRWWGHFLLVGITLLAPLGAISTRQKAYARAVADCQLSASAEVVTATKGELLSYGKRYELETHAQEACMQKKGYIQYTRE